jgi:hypothetical protein
MSAATFAQIARWPRAGAATGLYLMLALLFAVFCVADRFVFGTPRDDDV